MRIGIDIDGTITHCPEFFRIMTSLFSGKHDIYIITARDDQGSDSFSEKVRDETIEELLDLGIVYDHLIFSNRKGKTITDEKIEVFFEDEDEHIQGIPDECLVLKVRETFNYDWHNRKWFFSNKTGQNIDSK